nr:MAG TPA: restriction alleviation protein [Caudoviricetes sp.]
MTETPKCPYCGAELEVTHAFVNDATAAHKLVYTCFCRECGVYTPKRSTPEEALSAALHRAEPEMRPLTLDEIYAKIDDEDWNVVWIEGPDSQKAEPMCPYYKEGNKIVFCAPPFVRVWEETISRYGKSWRCWPRKPTPEQMTAAKWEE